MKKTISQIEFVLQFAKDDFERKYMGSILGVAWAFVQPLTTILVYWFVFQLGFRSQPVQDMPFILWLIAGLIPWFFISEGIASATTCLADYEYLVKKVRFNIGILPIIKIVSSYYVQLVLIVFTIIAYAVCGYAPTLLYFQLVYYSLYMFLLAQGIAYITSAIYVFFRDSLQLISVILQVVFWLTPMVWSMGQMPEGVQKVIKFNPLYFVVSGYRKTFVTHEIFLTDGYYTLYYWIVLLTVFFTGKKLYDKLSPHFADVL